MSSPFIIFNTNIEFDSKKLLKNNRNLSNLYNSLETLSCENQEQKIKLIKKENEIKNDKKIKVNNNINKLN